MTDKKYSGFGSRIVLKTLTPLISSDDEDIFLSDSIPDRPELRVQLRYFTVELAPSRSSVKKDGGKYNSPVTKSTNSSRNGQNKEEAKALPGEAASCESFYSCRSTTSVQEMKCNANELSSVQQGLNVRKTIRDDDLLNHLTIVNAIFLSNSASESPQNGPKTNSDGMSVSCASSKAPTETYSCQVNNNLKERYTGNMVGDGIKTKSVSHDLGYFDRKKSFDKLTYSKTFLDSFEPFPNSKTRFEQVDFANKNDSKVDNINESSLPSSSFNKQVHSTSSVSVIRKLEERVCKMKFAEVNPLSEGHSLSATLEKRCTDRINETNQRRRRVIPGCEENPEASTQGKSVSGKLVCCSEENLNLTSPKNSSSLVYVDSAGNTLDPVDAFQKEFDLSGIQNIEISGSPLKTQQLKHLDDSCLRMMIRNSIKKLRYESKESLRAMGSDDCDIFEHNEQCDGLYENKCFNLTEVDCTNRSVVIEERKSIQSLDTSGWDSLKINKVDIHKKNHSLTFINENGIDHQKEYINTKRSESSKLDDKVEKGFCRRSLCDRIRTAVLPAIEEESSEEVLDERTNLREDNLDDDYCLIDSNGRPINLFDCKGLPLTDNNGRPLRSAQGKLLLHCDQSGIPVVDPESPIFDMLGRQPHEDGFDPAASPEAVGGRLTAGDGRPLLLFDAVGRPLTTRSGTMLLDARGHGLVQLTVP